MKVLVITKVGKSMVFNMSVAPCIGDYIDGMYQPMPVVKNRIINPTKETLGSLYSNADNIDILVMAE